MDSADAMKVVIKALDNAMISEYNRPRVLSDNRSCYISREFQTFIDDNEMDHVRGVLYHLQTQAKIERYHRTMKNVEKLENYFSRDELRAKLKSFMDYYNNQQYHESTGNATPAEFILAGNK